MSCGRRHAKSLRSNRDTKPTNEQNNYLAELTGQLALFFSVKHTQNLAVNVIDCKALLDHGLWRPRHSMNYRTLTKLCLFVRMIKPKRIRSKPIKGQPPVRRSNDLNKPWCVSVILRVDSAYRWSQQRTNNEVKLVERRTEVSTYPQSIHLQQHLQRK